MSQMKEDIRTTEESPRERLLRAGLEAFGLFNYEGASTRNLAERAGVNVAAIQYYFGGKEGLYRAVAGTIAERIKQGMEPAAAEARSLLARDIPDIQELIAAVQHLLRSIAGTLLTSEQSLYWARIVIREQTMPTSAYEIIYEGFLEPGNRLLAELVARILGRDSEDREVVLLCFTLIGQIIIFRGGTETVKRRLDWNELTESRVSLVQDMIAENTRALLEARMRSNKGAEP